MHDVRPQSLPFALSIITDLLLCLSLPMSVGPIDLVLISWLIIFLIESQVDATGSDMNMVPRLPHLQPMFSQGLCPT